MTLKDEVFKILAEAMGPAAGPFLERQCKWRLNKSAESLVASDLPTLARWTEIGTSGILNPDVAAKLASRIRALAGTWL